MSTNDPSWAPGPSAGGPGPTPPAGPPQSSWGGPAPARGPRNGLGTASLVLGIVSVLLCWTAVVAVAAVVGLVLGIVGLRRVRQRVASNRGVTVAGIATSAVGLVLSVLLGVVYVVAGIGIAHRISDCDPDAGQSQYEQCIRDRLDVD